MHVAIDDLRQGFDLQVANALWQPTGALTGVATATLVYEHGVEGPGTV